MMSAMEQQRAELQRWQKARDANGRIADSAERLQFVSRMPLFCECDDPVCEALVLIGREDYATVAADRSRRLTAPGHSIHNATTAERTPGYWLHQIS